MENLLETAAANQRRAREIIRTTGLEAIWRSVGAEPRLVGSLRTGLLMTHRDIDYHIYSAPARSSARPDSRRSGARSGPSPVWWGRSARGC